MMATWEKSVRLSNESSKECKNLEELLVVVGTRPALYEAVGIVANWDINTLLSRRGFISRS